MSTSFSLGELEKQKSSLTLKVSGTSCHALWTAAIKR